jgi:hypothetical protein
MMSGDTIFGTSKPAQQEQYLVLDDAEMGVSGEGIPNLGTSWCSYKTTLLAEWLQAYIERRFIVFGIMAQVIYTAPNICGWHMRAYI